MKLINNRFEVIEKLDKIIGHQSYTVVDLKDGNKIKALTFFDYNKDKKLVAYYLEEFISLYNIKHKNLLESYSFHIVETIDDKRANISLHFLVHELSQGDFLYLKEAELTKKDRINTLLDLMNLIDFLHFIGVTYKHLSPDNIFVSSNQRVKVSCLGIISERNIRLSYQTMTEHFIAPEIHQYLSVVDEKSDYFSLGMVMKYLLLKDYRAKNIDEKDFINKLTFNRNEKKLLINIMNNLTQYDPSKRDIKLRTHIDKIIEVLRLDYSNDFKSERNNINDRIKIQGRDLEIQKVLKHDDLLRNGSKEYSGIVFTGSKGAGKTRLLEELDFQIRIRDRQNIRISIDSKDKSLNKNIIKLVRASLELASKDLISKYDLEFNSLFGSFVEEEKEDIYSSEFKNRYRLFNRITNYFIELSKIKLIYIFIDDIHNSNHEFLSLLKYLVKNLKDENVFFIFSCLELSMTVESSVRDDILELINLENLMRSKLRNIKEADFNNIIKSKFGFIDDNDKIISILYNASEGNLLKLDYIVKDLLDKKEIYINECGHWETKINNYKDEFRYLEIHHILRKQLSEVSKESLEFINIASAFDKYIFVESIVQMMNLSFKLKEKIINQLLEKKIIKKSNNNGLDIYIFLNTELKRLLYHELDAKNRKSAHEGISDFILKLIKEDKINLENNNGILKELSFQLLKSNREKLALKLILKKAQIKKNQYHIKSIDLWELAYSLIQNDDLYESNYKTLYVVKNLIELYFLKGEKKDISIYIEELERISKMQNNCYYLIKSKFYKAEVCFLENNLDLISKIIIEISDLSDKHNIIQGKILSLYIKSKLSLNLNNWEELLETANELIEISKKNGKIKYLGNIYNILGLYYKYNGNANEAIKSYDKSIEYFTKINNVAEVIKPINNIAGVYTDHLHDDNMGISFFKKGYKISLEYNLLQGISVFSLNLGITYGENFEFEKALKYLQKADEVYKYRKEFRGMFATAIHLGITYLNKDDIVNTYKLYSRIQDMFNNNKILDVELTSAYYSFLSKFYGYFGIWDIALINIVIAKEEFQKQVLNLIGAHF